MFRLIPRRSAAVVAALAFAFAMGEGVLASVCGPEVEMEACADGEMVQRPVMESEAGGNHGMAAAGHIGTSDGADAQSSAACCPSPESDGTPSSGSGDSTPCPLALMGLGGACQGAAFLGSTVVQPVPPSETLPALGRTSSTHDIPFASPPFEPPRD